MAAVAPLSRAPGRFLRVRPSARGPCGTAMTDRRTAKDGLLLRLLQMMRMMMMGLENAWLYHHQRRAGPATEWPVEKSAPAVRQARCVQSPGDFQHDDSHTDNLWSTPLQIFSAGHCWCL